MGLEPCLHGSFHSIYNDCRGQPCTPFSGSFERWLLRIIVVLSYKLHPLEIQEKIRWSWSFREKNANPSNALCFGQSPKWVPFIDPADSGAETQIGKHIMTLDCLSSRNTKHKCCGHGKSIVLQGVNVGKYIIH